MMPAPGQRHRARSQRRHARNHRRAPNGRRVQVHSDLLNPNRVGTVHFPNMLSRSNLGQGDKAPILELPRPVPLPTSR